MNKYKENNDLYSRQQQAQRVLNKYYPNKIPVIVQRHHSELVFSELDKQKFLVPKDMNHNSFAYVIRRHLNIDNQYNSSGIAFFMTTANGQIISSNDIIFNLYEDHKDDDGFLYLFYSGENTFG